MRRHLVGDLVAFEHVLERGDVEAELVGQAHQHQDLVLPVGVAVDQPLAAQDLGEGFELQVAPRRQPRLVAGLPRVPARM